MSDVPKISRSRAWNTLQYRFLRSSHAYDRQSHWNRSARAHHAAGRCTRLQRPCRGSTDTIAKGTETFPEIELEEGRHGYRWIRIRRLCCRGIQAASEARDEDVGIELMPFWRGPVFSCVELASLSVLLFVGLTCFAQSITQHESTCSASASAMLLALRLLPFHCLREPASRQCSLGSPSKGFCICMSVSASKFSLCPTLTPSPVKLTDCILFPFDKTI